jgi:hypothetical protein
MANTYIIDIDGTLVKHQGGMTRNIESMGDVVRQEFINQFFEKLYLNDAKIILLTGRKENLRNETVNQLKKLNIQYDELIMGCPRGPRHIINDRKPNDGNPTAISLNVNRNSDCWCLLELDDIYYESDSGWRQLVDYIEGEKYHTLIYRLNIRPNQKMKAKKGTTNIMSIDNSPSFEMDGEWIVNSTENTLFLLEFVNKLV